MTSLSNKCKKNEDNVVIRHTVKKEEREMPETDRTRSTFIVEQLHKLSWQRMTS